MSIFWLHLHVVHCFNLVSQARPSHSAAFSSFHQDKHAEGRSAPLPIHVWIQSDKMLSDQSDSWKMWLRHVQFLARNSRYIVRIWEVHLPFLSPSAVFSSFRTNTRREGLAHCPCALLLCNISKLMWRKIVWCNSNFSSKMVVMRHKRTHLITEPSFSMALACEISFDYAYSIVFQASMLILQARPSHSTVFNNSFRITDMLSDPHLEGQTRILANQPTFSCAKFVLALMEWPAFRISYSLYFVLEGGA